MVRDDEIDTPVFGEALLGMVDDEARRLEMRRWAKGLAQDQAAAVLADQVVRAVRGVS